MTRKTQTRKTAIRQSSAPSHSKAERMTLHTLEEALTVAVRTFAPDDAVGSLGDAYCPVSEIAMWMATQPAEQCMARRYVVGKGIITDLITGHIASQFMTVEMIPAHVHVRQDKTSRVRWSETTFLFAIESLRFVTSTGAWDRTGRVRPVALHENGLEFEDA